MQNRLIDAILDFPQPKNTQKVRQFIVLANFYWSFINNYAHIVQSISDILRNNNFELSGKKNTAFSSLKSALTSALMLAHPSPTKQFAVSTNASKHAFGANLQKYEHPIAYLSHISNAETNWDTGDHELLALMIALKEWSVYLRGIKFMLKTDHEPIIYLQTKSQLTGRQKR